MQSRSSMQLIITLDDGSVLTIDVAEDMKVEDLFTVCLHESTYLANASRSKGTVLSILFEGRTYTDAKIPLKQIGLQGGDLILVRVTTAAPSQSTQNFISGLDFSQIKPTSSTASRSNPLEQVTQQQIQSMYDKLMSDANALRSLSQDYPELADAVDKKDFTKFARLCQEGFEANRKKLQERSRILSDPFSADAQKLLLQEIQQKQVDEQMQTALEHTPESFGSVVMLYINCKVNGRPLKAFVDSGAQKTLMSEKCVEKCNLSRFVDKRFSGMASGIGKARILGRIHLAQLQIENAFLPVSFTVLENQGTDILFGLDMLRRHQCLIDLAKNELVIGTTGCKTPFLPESEIPVEFRDDSLAVDGQSNEKKVETLVQMGFDRKVAEAVLTELGGDVDRAAAVLLERNAHSKS